MRIASRRRPSVQRETEQRSASSYVLYHTNPHSSASVARRPAGGGLEGDCRAEETRRGRRVGSSPFSLELPTLGRSSGQKSKCRHVRHPFVTSESHRSGRLIRRVEISAGKRAQPTRFPAEGWSRQQDIQKARSLLIFLGRSLGIEKLPERR